MKDNLIGELVLITHSKNKTLIGVKGRVVDETKNTFTIEVKDSNKKVLKKEVRFMITTQGDREIDGRHFIGLPAERLKKKIKVKKRW